MMAVADPERALALAHAPAGRRAALAALWALDERLCAVAMAARDPMIGAIRLAWWRETLAGLDSGPIVGEPLIEALRAGTLVAGIDGRALAGLVDGWEMLLDAMPLADSALAEHAEQRGESLWRIGALLLGRPASPAQLRAGGGWALVDLAFRVADGDTARRAAEMARARLGQGGERWPTMLRPLGMLVALARNDLTRVASRTRPVGSPGRVARMLWHRISGW